MESPLKYNAFLTNTNNHFQYQGIIMGASAVFLDRDGVINQEFDYVHTIDEFKFIKNVIPAMKMIKDKGYALIIVTNQSGIARGYYTEEDFLKLTEWMDWSLQLEGIRLDGIYYCPHHPTEGIGEYRCQCDCRKPAPGMFYEARDYRDLDLAKCYMVGDRTSDIESGINAGIKNNILVRTGYPLDEQGIKMASGVFDTLMDFAKSLPVLPESDRPKKLKPKQKNQESQTGESAAETAASETASARTGSASGELPDPSREIADSADDDFIDDEAFTEMTRSPESKIFMDTDEEWSSPEVKSAENSRRHNKNAAANKHHSGSGNNGRHGKNHGADDNRGRNGNHGATGGRNRHHGPHDHKNRDNRNTGHFQGEDSGFAPLRKQRNHE